MSSLFTLLLAAVALVGLARLGRRLAATDEARTALPGFPNIPVVAVGAALLVAGLSLGSLGAAAGTLKIIPVTPSTPANEGIDPDGGAGVDEGFMRWIEPRIPIGDSFVIVCGKAPCDETQRFFMTARLAPRIPAARASDADWILFTGNGPTDSSLRPGQYSSVEPFGTKAIARTTPTSPTTNIIPVQDKLLKTTP